MKRNYQIFWKRTFYALLILFIIIPTFVLTFYGQVPGKIIGMIIFMSLAILGIYEICSFMTKNITTTLIFALILVVGTFLLPFNAFEILLWQGVADGNNLKGLIYYNFTWQTFIFPLLSVILFVLIDPKLRKTWQIFTKNFAILILIAYFTAFFAKGVWVINIFDWTKIIFLLSIAALSDTSAYIGGALFGKKWFYGAKLAPRISPSKTWAGAIIAWFITVTFAIVVSYYIGFWNGVVDPLVLSIIGGIFLAIMAQIGDLIFSGFKRLLSTKDFSSLIPIHGGIFDRVDGMSVVVFTTILLFIFG